MSVVDLREGGDLTAEYDDSLVERSEPEPGPPEEEEEEEEES